MSFAGAPVPLTACHSPLPIISSGEPSSDCVLCPRLHAFRHQNRWQFSEWFNAPVPSFGPVAARLLIVGLAPGLRGANRTGRPFTGDYAGVLLYETLLHYGFASGRYAEQASDGLELVDCRITNSVRCVPPKNKPLPAEVQTCSLFLAATLSEMPNLRIILTLGRIAFDSVLRTFKLKVSAYPFRHGAGYDLPHGVKLYGSYHCSRYNTNTGRLTTPMFHRVFESISAGLQARASKESRDA